MRMNQRQAVRWRRTAGAILMLALTACGNAGEAELLESAQKRIDRNEVPAAIIELKSALQVYPESARARLMLGRMLLEAGDPVAAGVELQKAADGGAAEADVLPLIAQSMLYSGKAADVLARMGDKKLGSPKADAELQTVIARAYSLQGEHDKAKAAIEQALALQPEHAPAVLMRARYLAEGGAHDAARKIVDDVIARTPGDIAAWTLKAEIARHRQPPDFDAALQAYREALKQRPDALDAHAGVLIVQLARDDIAGAREQLAQLRRVAPNAPLTRLYTAELAFRENDLNAAREAIQVLVKSGVDDSRILTMAGTIELRAGALGQAQSFLRRALSQQPDNPAAAQLLADTHLKNGQPDAAIEVLKPFVERPQATADQLSKAAEANLAAGRVDEAMSLFARAVQVDPAHTRARTMVALGDVPRRGEEALARLATIAAASTDDFADLALIGVRLKRGEFDAALSAVAALEKKRPASAIAPLMRGRVLTQRGDLDGARKAYEAALAREKGYYAAVGALAAMDEAAGNLEGAEQRLRAYLGPDVENPMARAWLIDLRARRGADPAELGELVSDMSRRHPGQPASNVLMVNHLLATGDVREALATAQKAAAQLPQSPAVLDALGRAQLAAGDREQALASFRKSAAAYQAELRVNEDPAVAVGLYRALSASGEADASNAFAGQWLKKHPADPLMTSAMAEQALRSSNWAEAEKHLRSLLSIQPSNPDAVNNLAWTLLQLRKPGALDLAQKAVKLRPAAAPYLDTLAAAQAERGMHAEAVTTQREAIKLRPDDPSLRFNLVRWLTASGDRESARRELEALSLSKDPRVDKAAVARMMGELRGS